MRLLEEFLKLKRKELAVPNAPPGPAQYERYHARRTELLRELEVKLAAYARERKEKDSEPANVRQSVDDEREQMVRHLKSTLRLEFPTAARLAGEEDTRLETIETRVRNHIEWVESMHRSGVKLPFGARRDEYAELHRLFNADNFDNAAGLTERLERMARRDPGLINSESVLSAATVRNKNPEGFREFLYKNNYPFYSDYELRDVDARLTGSTSPERVLIPTPLHIGALAAFFGAAAEGGDFVWAQAGRYRKPRSPAPELRSLRAAAAGFGRDDGARLHWAGTTDTRGDSTDVFLFVDNRTGKMVLVAARYEIPEEHRRIRHDGVPELLAKRAEDARAAVPPPPPPTVRSPTEIGKIRDHLEASLFSAPDAPTAPLHALFRRIEKIPFSDKQFGDLKGALARAKGERDLDSVRRLLDEMEKTNAK